MVVRSSQNTLPRLVRVGIRKSRTVFWYIVSRCNECGVHDDRYIFLSVRLCYVYPLEEKFVKLFKVQLSVLRALTRKQDQLLTCTARIEIQSYGRFRLLKREHILVKGFSRSTFSWNFMDCECKALQLQIYDVASVV